jgi:DnaJ-class molecular chaperone
MTLYDILGVSESASNAEIRDAYRNLAKEYHPDKFPGSDKPFREIQEAWEILKDTDKKRAYDSKLASSRKSTYQNHTPEQPRPHTTATTSTPKPASANRGESTFLGFIRFIGFIILISIFVSGIYAFFDSPTDLSSIEAINGASAGTSTNASSTQASTVTRIPTISTTPNSTTGVEKSNSNFGYQR